MFLSLFCVIQNIGEYYSKLDARIRVEAEELLSNLARKQTKNEKTKIETSARKVSQIWEDEAIGIGWVV